MLPLMPYQEEGAAFLASRSRAGLFDEPGAGKTAQAVRLADNTQARRIVVVCPAIARQNWIGEFRKFGRQQRKVVKAATVHDFRAWQRGVFDVLVVSYEMAGRWAPLVEEYGQPIDLLVLDEAHYLKNIEAKRSRLILGPGADGVGGMLGWAIRAAWITGTPIPTDPADIWTFLRAVGVMPFGFERFKNHYFNVRLGTYSAQHTPRPDRIAELRTLIENNSIRRTLADIGVQLPPIFLTTSLVEGDTSAVREMLMQHPGLDDRLMANVRSADPATFSLASAMKQADIEHIGTLRRLIGEAKAVPYAAQIVHELGAGLDKVVIFGQHRLALQTVHRRITEAGMHAAVIDGSTPEKARQAYMEGFARDATFRALVCNVRAAGVALTLTAAAALDMLEIDWSPAANWQAIKRVHRLTQTRSVRARFITLADSFDEAVSAAVADKTRRIGEIEGSPMLAVPA